MQFTTSTGRPLSAALADVDDDVTAIYARLSLDRKREKGSGPAQLKLGAELCDRNGWSERRKYRDDNNSATNGDYRPALSLDQKRAAIKELMTVRIHPVGRGARTFRPETVEVIWNKDQG